ncbi:DUF445 domain-containing protein [Leifsonia sp. PS1209]|uniref:DUF445 domain-containing protein n=1 Tax=Leifsonia sp. PS1209 TaxID=2724914 RepID=UPI001FF990B5|nr:DUF445 domain-containing protein [Leifsonia sp. PS1209]
MTAATRILSPSDAERLRALRRMKLIATGLFVLMAVIFVVAFTLQSRFAWLGYVRAAAEGGMVGALADWFAVTALFRHPLGLRIPHTAIIPNRKDEIGASLGEFVETNFLSDEVVAGKLGSIDIAGALGAWVAKPENARRVVGEASTAVRGLATMLDDETMRDAIEAVVRTHLIEPEWAPPIGRLGARILDSGGHHEAVDLVIDRLDDWIAANPDAFGAVVSARLPSWLPSFVDRLVDDRVYTEVRRFIAEVRSDQQHKLRAAIDGYLAELVDRLQHDPATIAKLEAAKRHAFDDPRVRELAGSAWQAARAAAVDALADPQSELRLRAQAALADAGARLAADRELGAKVNTWLTDAAVHLVATYRHDIASVISDTVTAWDPSETTEKIELQVGKDLQFIRINGTVVGSLAGLAIFTVATALLPA